MDKERQKQLLKIIVDEYIKAAEPVASGFLVHKLMEKVSSATVRNDMVTLEDDGYIEQPHTSAGRVPTEKAYRYYLDHFLATQDLVKSYKDKIDQINQAKNDVRFRLKELAKYLAEVSGQAIMVAFAGNDVYYTGISNLFSQPEFSQKEVVVDMSRIIDHLDGVAVSLFDAVAEMTVELGDSCPFGSRCASIINKITIEDHDYLVAMIGPMRMDYQKNINLINYLGNL
ncbi:TPA: hypothetical protein DF272_05700 [Candidatus Falkowbacteria bacterium]|nr:hypothetical protein [Candidatus Falkowbacteria bacterium]